MPLEKVISGGQTGADRGGLIAARQAGIPTGGWMPKGFLAEDGEHPTFATEYGIREHTSPHYPARTALNVKESEGTVRFAIDWESPGELLTLDLCRRYRRPHLDVTPGGERTPADVAAWVVANDVRVLNVAGNRERTCPGLEEFVVAFLSEVFRLLAQRQPER